MYRMSGAMYRNAVLTSSPQPIKLAVMKPLAHNDSVSKEPSSPAADEPVASRNLVQVIARAADILRALEGVPDGLSLGQIAQKVGLARSTVQRITGALEAEKLLIAASPTGRLRLGPALLRLAASVETDFAIIARPLITKLSNELGETVDFSSVHKDHLVFIDQIVGPNRLRTVSAIGETFPLYCTANGKAALAEMDDEAILRLVGRKYMSRTPSTITTAEALLREIKKIRQTGIAFDREEHMLGICAAGIALRDSLGNMVAVSVPVPTHRFLEHEQQIAESLLRTKEELQIILAS